MIQRMEKKNGHNNLNKDHQRYPISFNNEPFFIKENGNNSNGKKTTPPINLNKISNIQFNNNKWNQNESIKNNQTSPPTNNSNGYSPNRKSLDQIIPEELIELLAKEISKRLTQNEINTPTPNGDTTNIYSKPYSKNELYKLFPSMNKESPQRKYFNIEHRKIDSVKKVDNSAFSIPLVRILNQTNDEHYYPESSPFGELMMTPGNTYVDDMDTTYSSDKYFQNKSEQKKYFSLKQTK